jgi:NADH pyrophosphatase NudC (nudix superfamily)
MKYQAEFRKQYFAKIKDDGYELNGQMFAQMEKDLYIEWLETKLQNTSSNSDYAKCKDCGAPMNEGEAKTFTVCDDCWEKHYPYSQNVR